MPHRSNASSPSISEMEFHRVTPGNATVPSGRPNKCSRSSPVRDPLADPRPETASLIVPFTIIAFSPSLCFTIANIATRRNDTRLCDFVPLCLARTGYLRYASNDVARYAKHRGSISLDLRRRTCSILAVVAASSVDRATSYVAYNACTTCVCVYVGAQEHVFEMTAFQYVGRNSGQSQWPK